jgi:hypothetical protein
MTTPAEWIWGALKNYVANTAVTWPWAKGVLDECLPHASSFKGQRQLFMLALRPFMRRCSRVAGKSTEVVYLCHTVRPGPTRRRHLRHGGDTR